MKPYYDHAGITIYHGDCREIAPGLQYDAVVSDPPYGMNEDTDRTRFSGGGHAAGRGRSWRAPVVGDDAPFDPAPWIEKGHVILWGSNHYAARLPVGSTLVWIKKPDHLFGTFLSDCELAWMKGGCGVYAYRTEWGSAHAAVTADAVREHPTQKPSLLMKWCLAKVPAEAAILDPFMGSGTTLRAAKDLGRRAIGIEIEEKYCEIAVKRMSQEVLPLVGA